MKNTYFCFIQYFVQSGLILRANHSRMLHATHIYIILAVFEISHTLIICFPLK